MANMNIPAILAAMLAARRERLSNQRRLRRVYPVSRSQAAGDWFSIIIGMMAIGFLIAFALSIL